MKSGNPEFHNILSWCLLMTCFKIASLGGVDCFDCCCHCGSSYVVISIYTCGVFILVFSNGISCIIYCFWYHGKWCVIQFTSYDEWKQSFFGIGMVGGTKSYTVFVSLDKNIAVDLSIIEIAAWLISCWDWCVTRKRRYIIYYPLEHHPDWLRHIYILQKWIPLDVGYPRIWYYLQLFLLVIALLETLNSYQCRVHLRQRSSHCMLNYISMQKVLQYIDFWNRHISTMVLHSRPWCYSWQWAACLSQWIWFW